jgi:hypothetical protein
MAACASSSTSGRPVAAGRYQRRRTRGVTRGKDNLRQQQSCQARSSSIVLHQGTQGQCKALRLNQVALLEACQRCGIQRCSLARRALLCKRRGLSLGDAGAQRIYGPLGQHTCASGHQRMLK